MVGKAVPFLDRIALRFDITEDECWEWNGASWSGYGKTSREGRTQMAHRAVWEEVVGPIPEGLQLDHLCRNRSCINPDHLEPVTQAENIRRGDGGKYWANKTECKWGHPYDESNTYRYPDGTRACRTCRATAMQRWQDRQRDKDREGLWT